MNKLKQLLDTRLGFFSLAVVLFWAKTYISYLTEFSLSVDSVFQHFILLINPIATTILLFSTALYFKKSKHAYIALFIIYFLTSALLFANMIYYREFTDFLSVSTILGSSNVASGLGASTFALMRYTDILFWADFVFLLALILSKKTAVDKSIFKKRYAVALTILGITLFAGNLALAESDRPQLLMRTFDRHYIVKYLGLNFFTAYDGYQTAQTNQVRASADESDMDSVFKYTEENYAEPDSELFGIAEGRNVIYLHLESFQQFLIDYELEDENGELHEVTPFLNSLFHDEATQSFENFFHQVGQGKTADSEMLLENSLFGLPQGGAFVQVGTDNTFQSASQILRSEAGYTSAMFHGNVGSFWNRNDTYKSMGIDYFFDSDDYTFTSENTLEYGMKDKIFFQESVQYLEQLQQPFYSKFITVSNHFPYPLDEENADFPAATTDDETINNYFVTAHYLDQAIEEFFNYLKESGLYDNSIIVLYGDHYGISNSRNQSLAPLLDEDPLEWSNYDNAMMQRVPLMYHIPGTTNGEIHSEYGGMVDMLPTLLNLLGIETKDYVLLGSDLFSEDSSQTVAFRNGDFVTPVYTVIGSEIYDTESGELIDDPSEDVLSEVESLQEDVNTQLGLSDNILSSDLLRFYTPEGMENAKSAEDFNYSNQLERLKALNDELGSDSTSLYGQNNNESTVDLYETNAPELQNDETEDGSETEQDTDEPEYDPQPDAEQLE